MVFALEQCITEANKRLSARWGEDDDIVYDIDRERNVSILLVDAGRSMRLFGNHRWTVKCWVDRSYGTDWRPAIKKILREFGFVERRFF